jgi:phosphatidylglycerol---prolipoprotein diacylglyceryl transferase
LALHQRHFGFDQNYSTASTWRDFTSFYRRFRFTQAPAMTWVVAVPATWAIPAHQLLEFAGIALGARFYWALSRRSKSPGSAIVSYAVLVGLLLGSGIGNKLVFWIEMPHLLPMLQDNWLLIFGGQSMVGGLLGGLIGVEVAKALSRQTSSTGDLFVFPLLLGLMIGRVGCFLAGLQDATYGVPATVPWAVDFGDGVARHPTQLYEIAFCAAAWFALRQWQHRLAPVPGLLFKALTVGYLLWRLGVDSIKPVPFAYAFGLSGIQWVCIAALLVYVPVVRRAVRQLQGGNVPTKTEVLSKESPL